MNSQIYTVLLTGQQKHINGQTFENQTANQVASIIDMYIGDDCNIPNWADGCESFEINGDLNCQIIAGYTYDVFFSDDENNNNKGWHESLDYCREYIAKENGTNHSYFADYKGGFVSIVRNETGETVFEEAIY